MSSDPSSLRVEVAEAFEDLRPLLFSISYRMLGSVAEAEDIVQETFVRYHRALLEQGAEIDSPKAYLSAVTTRLAIDHLRSARARKESYVGEWLPEPLLTDERAPDGARYAEDADSLSMAFLLLLERLSPVERAVFLLHDVFDYGYDEVAAIVGKSEDNCRQLAVRARRHVDEHKPRFEASRRERDRLANRFFGAVEEGDMDSLIELLAADVVVYGDGGGTSPSWRRPIFGRDRVLRLMLGIGRHSRELGGTIRRSEINGQPGVLFLDPEGRLMHVLTVDIADGAVQTVRGIINPDKLRHLGPLADVRALMREQKGTGAMSQKAGLPRLELREQTRTRRRAMMEAQRRIAVAGATGRVGRHAVEVLESRGHEVVAISRSGGIDLVTGEGLAGALAGVEAVIDAATGPSAEEAAATEFFLSVSRNLQEVGERAGVQRIVVVSIIGIERFSGGYGAAKVAHERAMLAGPVPARILRATQFHEFVGQLVDWGRQGDVSYVPNTRLQPVAARAVAEALADLALDPGAGPAPRLDPGDRRPARGEPRRPGESSSRPVAATRCGSRA